VIGVKALNVIDCEFIDKQKLSDLIFPLGKYWVLDCLVCLGIMTLFKRGVYWSPMLVLNKCCNGDDNPNCRESPFFIVNKE
jgi:hypothetical protein